MRVCLAWGIGLAVLWGCRDPTQITLELHTDAPCDGVETAIFVGTPGKVENVAPAATTGECNGGDIGSLVLVPRDTNNLSVGVRVALSVTGNLDECLTPTLGDDGVQDYGDSCIIARRSLRYIEHTPLTVPVDLSVVCQGKFCDANTTCVDGQCVDAMVDPEDCKTTDDCMPIGTGGGGGAGVGGAGGEGGSSGLPCGPSRTTEATQVGALTNPRNIVIESGGASCTWAIAWTQQTTMACIQTFDASGMDPADVVCGDHGQFIGDLELAHVGSDTYVMAAWGGMSAKASVWRLVADGLKEDSDIEGVRNGALAGRGDQLAIVHQTAADTIRYDLYLLNDMLTTLGESVDFGAGSDPDVSMGTDVAVTWRNEDGMNDAVTRFAAGGDPVQQIQMFQAGSVSAIAHAVNDTVGLLYINSSSASGAADLKRMVGAVLDNQATRVTAENASRLRIVRAPGGWAVAYMTDPMTAYVAIYNEDGTLMHGPKAVATSVLWIDIAAYAGQLGVAWVDAAGVKFRYLRADLDGL